MTFEWVSFKLIEASRRDVELGLGALQDEFSDIDFDDNLQG